MTHHPERAGRYGALRADACAGPVRQRLIAKAGGRLLAMALAALLMAPPAARASGPSQPAVGTEVSSTPLKGDAGARSAPMPALAPIPSWVTPVSPDLSHELPADAYGVDYLLLDQQTRVTANDRFSFRHRADRIRSERGLDATGRVEVSFNPAYQTVQFHQLRIHRNGQVMPWQQRTRVRWLDRETQLEQGIYDGTRTLSLTLDDLRVGDVLEYAYTVRGANPVFGGRQFGGADLQYAVPIARQYIRLLMPAGRDPVVESAPAMPMQRQTLAGGEQEWRWDVADAKALRMDSNTPSWFNPYPRVAWSEFEDWGAVARWAAPMYEPSATPPPALQRELDELMQRFATPQERVAGALRLVQERVRYLSVSIGAGSHAPRRPEQVLAQRFGDCKDKSLLTVALLRGMGLQAWVALVNTQLRGHLDGELPSAGAFDHAIVLTRFNGRDYWLDPTRAPQQGTLDQLVQADFGRALVIDPATSALTAIATAPSSVERREMTVEFDLSAGPSVPSGYQVTTRYFGAAAERLRSEYGTGDGRLERLQKQMLGYYARSFNDIKVAAPLQWQDDAQANVVTVSEHYSIGKLWNLTPKGYPQDAVLGTPSMDALLQRPDLSERQHPLRRNHPERLEMTVTARLPAHWRTLRGESGEHKVEDEHFSFRRTYALRDHTLTLTQQYASLQDHVAPKKMADYVKHLKDADDWSGYRLNWSLGGLARDAVSPSDGEPGNSNVAALALLAIGLLLGLMRLFHPAALLLKARMERFPLPAQGPRRSALGSVVLVEGGGTSAVAVGPADLASVQGPGKDGWRRWLNIWALTALALHTLNGMLVWLLYRHVDQKVLQTPAHWIYGLGAIALGAFIMRSMGPSVCRWLREWQLQRLGETAYRALLWRTGFSDDFPAASDASFGAGNRGRSVVPAPRQAGPVVASPPWQPPAPQGVSGAAAAAAGTPTRPEAAAAAAATD